MPRIRKELGEQSNPKERRKLIMKFIFTVLLLTVLYRQRYRIYKTIHNFQLLPVALTPAKT